MEEGWEGKRRVGGGRVREGKRRVGGGRVVRGG